MTRLAALLALLAALSAPAQAIELRFHAQATAGQMTDNEWGDLLGNFDSVRGRNSLLLGAGAGVETRLGPIGHIGIEANAFLHAGQQDHVEFTLPVTIRTPRPRWALVPSLAYGVGLSYATRTPQVEIFRTGSSARLIAHWFLEAEFGNDESEVRPFVRIHHRSDAWGIFDADTGSNAILIGLRIPFD